MQRNASFQSLILAFLFFSLLFLNACQPQNTEKHVLVFYKAEGFVHQTIPDGIAAVEALGKENGFAVSTTDDNTYFTDENLKNHHAVIFMNTSGEVFTPQERIAFQRFIQAGGGFVGVHLASGTERTWPWFRQLVGAEFIDHPKVQQANIQVLDNSHPATAHLPETWTRTDEWYNFKNIYDGIKVILQVDESSYEGGKNGAAHPISWYHTYDGGRAFYTALGHTKESYSEADFLQHLLGGIEYAIGSKALNYNLETVMPEESRFEKVVLDYYLDEPMELDLLPDGRLIFTQRKGQLNIHDPKEGQTRKIADFEVYSKQEDGLLGVTLDPNYAENNWLYVFYSYPEAWEQRISRFDFDPDAEVPLSNEKVLLKAPVQRAECCHSGGSLEFGPDGNLFISLGDDTNPFASNGYGPIDERPGRSAWDAQKSSANTNDLRGKILRIKPEADGSYSIPDGNLFPKDGSQGRPEIYVMGCRNPFRISIDAHTKFLYWGDVGPDANEDNENRGPMGHDEVNQARKAGFFGWPYFVGDNKAYLDYNFQTKTSEAAFDPNAVINDSPNNTGIQQLPPAQPAMIYYPYRETPVFPLVGSGGRNAMAGPVFYHDDYPDNPRRFPKYYDKKFFSYDWMRGFMMANTLDEEGNLVLMEPFLPSIKWNNLTDIIMSPQGDMFMIEYGTGWFTANEDARLVHLKYTPGNRRPKAKIEADQSVGGLPLTVQFDASTSIDYDGDDLTYEWNFGGGQKATGAQVSHTFTEAAAYKVELTVRDPAGNSDQTSMQIKAGNAPPQVKWTLAGNQDFYWPGTPVEYELQVEDQEDGSLQAGIDPKQVKRSMEYLEQGYDLTEIAQGHQIVAARLSNEAGLKLIEGSDCQSCHKEAGKSIGPSYLEVAQKYQGNDTARAYLAQKIINGGAGVWGETAMAAHPNITPVKAKAMASYILSLADVKNDLNFPLNGTAELQLPKDKRPGGVFVFIANYMDQGAAEMDPLKSQHIFSLRSPLINANENRELFRTKLTEIRKKDLPQLSRKANGIVASSGAYAAFGPMDLTSVQAIKVAMDMRAEFGQGGTISMYLDDPESSPVGEVTFLPVDNAQNALVSGTIQLPATEGRHQVYFRFTTKNETGGKPIGHLISLELIKQKTNSSI